MKTSFVVGAAGWVGPLSPLQAMMLAARVGSVQGM